MAQPALCPRRLAANRANARKSTGPRTAEGKARSARNRTTFGFYRRGLVPLPPLVLQPALQRAQATAAFFHHDPQFAQMAAGYILLCAHHTYLCHNIDAFATWMLSAANPGVWARRHGSFLTGALYALSRLRGRLREVERVLLPARLEYYRRLDAEPPALPTHQVNSRASNPPIASSSPFAPPPADSERNKSISDIPLATIPGSPPNPATQSRPPHLASGPTPVYPEVNPPPERPCCIQPVPESLAFQRKGYAIADPQTS